MQMGIEATVGRCVWDVLGNCLVMYQLDYFELSCFALIVVSAMATSWAAAAAAVKKTPRTQGGQGPVSQTAVPAVCFFEVRPKASANGSGEDGDAGSLRF